MRSTIKSYYSMTFGLVKPVGTDCGPRTLTDTVLFSEPTPDIARTSLTKLLQLHKELKHIKKIITVKNIVQKNRSQIKKTQFHTIPKRTLKKKQNVTCHYHRVLNSNVNFNQRGYPVGCNCHWQHKYRVKSYAVKR